MYIKEIRMTEPAEKEDREAKGTAEILNIERAKEGPTTTEIVLRIQGVEVTFADQMTADHFLEKLLPISLTPTPATRVYPPTPAVIEEREESLLYRG